MVERFVRCTVHHLCQVFAMYNYCRCGDKSIITIQMDFETLNAICHHSLSVEEKPAKVRSFGCQIIANDAKPFQRQVAMRAVGALPRLMDQQTGYRLYIHGAIVLRHPAQIPSNPMRYDDSRGCNNAGSNVDS